MEYTQYDYINKTLAIIDACQTDAILEFSFNLPESFFDLTNPENKKGNSIKKYLDKDFNFILTKQNKKQLIKDLASNFEDGEICHYTFYFDSNKSLIIGQGWDHCEFNILSPYFFKLTPEHLKILDDSDIQFAENID